ncbi:MAG: hypothetical protein H6617_03060 [Bdellovibrionaceae bacterium]|nr:hypothetical protein [Bdellovibrionales bacterium]MCB9253639.1 hypothetical protein [Pseudobdellovibrionaceae bacterium]
MPTEEQQTTESQEADHLRYIGNKVPRVLRLAWTIFFAFMFYYLIKYAWPNLQEWMN